jgi:hypothetical protein
VACFKMWGKNLWLALKCDGKSLWLVLKSYSNIFLGYGETRQKIVSKNIAIEN